MLQQIAAQAASQVKSTKGKKGRAGRGGKKLEDSDLFNENGTPQGFDSYGFSTPVNPELPCKRGRSKVRDQGHQLPDTPKWQKRPRGMQIPVEDGEVKLDALDNIEREFVT